MDMILGMKTDESNSTRLVWMVGRQQCLAQSSAGSNVQEVPLFSEEVTQCLKDKKSRNTLDHTQVSNLNCPQYHTASIEDARHTWWVTVPMDHFFATISAWVNLTFWNLFPLKFYELMWIFPVYFWHIFFLNVTICLQSKCFTCWLK